MSIVRELRRRNVFRVAIAYLIIAWLVLQVGDILAPALHLDEMVNTALAFFLILGFPIALILAWAFEITPDGLKKERNVDRSQSITHKTGRKIDFIIIGLMSVALIFFASTHQWNPDGKERPESALTASSREQSIAVLPFVNMSDDPGNEYFSDGISEELLNVLVKIEGLRVASRTSSFSFKGKDTPIPGIAKQLNVDHILEGSVRKAGNTVRVTAQLIDVRTDSHLWSETYDRELEDIFAIQDEISGQIVEALKVALGADDQAKMSHAQKPTENLEAYELYLRGRHLWQRRGEENIRNAIDLFDKATALDTQFARAWSSLAAAHMTLPTYSDASRPVHDALSMSAAFKALALDESLAEAHAVLGDVARAERKWSEARGHYLRAIAAEPKNATAHLWYGEHLVSVGRLRDAVEENLIAYQLDPLHPGTNVNLAAVYLYLGEAENAIKYGAAAWDLGHRGGVYISALAYLQLEEFDRARELARQVDDLRPELLFGLLIEANIDATQMPPLLEALKEHEAELTLRDAFVNYGMVGEIDAAYRVVNSDQNDTGTNTWFRLWPAYMTEFRQDPRFTALVTRLGLMDYWRDHGWPDACQPAGEGLSCQ